MLKANFKFPIILAVTVILVLGLSISFQSLLAAWTSPTADPPGGNTNPPIYNAGTLNLPVINKPLTINDDFFVGADKFFVDKATGNVGIGTTNPSEKLEIDGKIISDGISLKQAFIVKGLPEFNTDFTDNTPTCQMSWNDLPQEIKDRDIGFVGNPLDPTQLAGLNGRCFCDADINVQECEISDLIATDQPGCFDLWKQSLDATYANYGVAACNDLLADKMSYSVLWKLEQKDNQISSSFVSYGVCNEILLIPGNDVGIAAKEALKESSCVKIILEENAVYTWEEKITIGRDAKVFIYTKNVLNGGGGPKATITISNKNIFYYNLVTYREPVRARIDGYLKIRGVIIDEQINDNRTITQRSDSSALFTINNDGVFDLSNGEILATEDIVNFKGWSRGGTFGLGYLWVYRQPFSPRANLYVVRANDGWNFSGQNGIVGWSNVHMYLNEKQDGTTGTGVQKYPPNLNEKKRLDYPDDRLADGNFYPSDIRRKKEIINLTDSLEKISELQGVIYKWREQEGMDDKKHIGFIAQDFEKVIPEAVNTDEDGYKSIDYDKITAVLVEAVKELKVDNEVLKQLICLEYPEDEACK